SMQAGYTYQWTGPCVTPAIENLSGFTIASVGASCSGQYCLTVELAGCVSMATCIDVVVNPVPVISELSHTDPTTCTPGNDGTITIDGLTDGDTLTVTGIMPAQIIVVGNTHTFDTLTAGTYNISVTTTNGCVSNIINNIVLSEPTDPASPSVSNNSPACVGDDVQLTASTNGDSIYWSGPDSFVSNLQNPMVAGVDTQNAGFYSATIFVNGCASLTSQTEVFVNPTPMIVATDSINPSNCAVADGEITIDSLISGQDYILIVDGVPTNITAAGTAHTITGLLAGCHTILVQTDPAGCSSNTVSVCLVDPNGPNAPNVNSNDPLCSGDDLVLSTDSISGTYTYEWTGVGLDNTNNFNPTVTLLGVTTANNSQYCLTVTEAGCVSVATCIDVIVVDVPTAPVVASPLNNVCPTITADLTTAVAPGIGTIVYRELNDINSTIVPDPTMVGAGLYYAFDSTASCISLGSEIEVVIISCCAIDSAGLDSVLCNDNGTPTDASDDFMDFELNVMGSNLSLLGYSIEGIQTVTTVVTGNGMYNTVENFNTTTGSAGNGNVTLTITDLDDATCQIQVTIIDPGTCFDCPQYAIGGTTVISDATSCFPGDEGQLQLTGLIGGSDYNVVYELNGVVNTSLNADASGNILISGLEQGTITYIVVTQMPEGCVSDTLFGPIVIGGPDLPTISDTLSTTDVSGCGVCDGEIVFTGLTPNTIFNIFYNLDGSPDSQTGLTSLVDSSLTLTGLCAGTYTDFIVVDVVLGCQSNPAFAGPITLSEPTTPILDSTNVTMSNPTGCGLCDGSLLIDGLEPNLAYSISYLNGTVQTVTGTSTGAGTLLIDNLCAGIYDDIIFTNTVTGCEYAPIAFGPFELVDPTSLTIGAITITTQPTACGVCDGVVTLSGGGMLANTQYDVHFSNNLIPDSLIGSFTNAAGELAVTGLCAGSYDNFTISDVNGCTSPVFAGPFDLVEPNAPLVDSVTTVDATNCGLCDGQIVIHLDATQLGNAPYDVTYSFGGSSSTINNVPLTGTTIVLDASLVNLCAGVYTDISIEDNGGCTTINETGPFTINEPTELVFGGISDSINPTSCVECNGSITLTGLDNATSYNIFYVFNGINKTRTITSGGTGDLQIDSLCAGLYEDIVVVNPITGCVSAPVGPVTLEDPVPEMLTALNVDTVDPSGCGVCDGQLEIDGLTPSITYTLDYFFNGFPVIDVAVSTNSSGEFILGSLCEGNYTDLILTNDITGCESPAITGGPFVLSDPLAPMYDSTNVVTTDPTGCGLCDGTIVISGLPVSTSISVDYTLNSVGQTPYTNTTTAAGILVIPNLCAGIYGDIVITDNVSTCISDAIIGTFEIADPTTLFIGVVDTVQQPTACGVCDGIITLTGGGMMPNTSYDINYTLDNVSAAMIPLFTDIDTIITLTGLCDGEYNNFTVTDATGCTSPVVVGPFTLVDPNAPIVDSITMSNPTNCGLCDGEIVIHLDPTQLGTNPYDVTYWIGGASTIINNVALTGTTIIIDNLCEGSYYDISIEDNGGCGTVTNAGPYVLDAPDTLLNVTLISANDPTSCGTPCDGSIELGGLPAGTYDVTYRFNGAPATSANGLVTTVTGIITIPDLCAGSYTELYVTNPTTGCNSLQVAGAPFILNDPNGPVVDTADITFTNPSDCGTDDGTITISNLVSGHWYIVDYFVVPPSSTMFTSPLLANVSGEIIFNNLGEGNYSNFHLVDTTTGCSSNYAVGSIDLIYPDFIIASISGTDPTTCGVCDGTITFSGLPINNTFILNYNSSTGPVLPPTSISSDAIGNATVSGLCQDFYYNFSLELIGGCSSMPVSDTITLTDPDATVIDSIYNLVHPTDCNTPCDGGFTIGNVAPFTSFNVVLQICGGAVQNFPVTSTFTGEIILTGLCAEDYCNIVVENTLFPGCYSNLISGPIVLTEPQPDLGVLLSTANDTICLGESVTLQIQAFDVVNTTVQWRYLDNDLNITPLNPMQNPVIVTPTDNRCYYVTYTDAVSGCDDYDTVCVIVSKSPILVADACTSLPEDSFVNLSIITDVYANDDMSNIYGSGDLNTNLDITILGEPTYGTIFIDEVNDSIYYEPFANFNGMDTVFYSVCNPDCINFCDSSYLCFNVISVNDPPNAIDDINNTIVDMPVGGDILSNDDETDGTGMNITLLNTGSNGTVVMNGGTLLIPGDYIYTPNSGFIGEDSAQYQLCDNAGLCDTAWIYFEIIEHDVYVNNPPIANNDVLVSAYDGTNPIITNILANDFDTDGDNIMATLLNLPDSGIIIFDGVTGEITYTPNNPNFVGTDEFEYYICDDGIPVLCDTAVVLIEIVPLSDPNLNHSPEGVDDATYTYTNLAVTGDVSLNDFDVDGDNLGFTLGNLPSNGTVVLDTVTGIYTYTPNPGYIGPDNFTYTVCDDGTPVLCDEATVYITIVIANTPPVAVDDINVTYMDISVTGDVSTNDFEVDGDSLSFTLVNPISGGTLTFNNDGTYTFTPPVGGTGDYTFTYVLCDDGNPIMCDTAEVVISVEDYDIANGVNNNPVANDDNIVISVNDTISISVLSNDFDIDGDSIFISSVINPNGLDVTIVGDEIVFNPPVGITGDFTFEYVICDNGTPVMCDTAEVTITIVSDAVENDPPFAVDDAYGTTVEVSISGNVMDNDILPNDGDNHSVNLLDSTSNGTLVFNTNGTFTYTPNDGYFGNDQFVYVLCDDGLPMACDTATVYILIYNDNKPPFAINDINLTYINEDVSGNVGTNDIEPEGDPVIYGIIPGSLSDGTIGFNSDGTYIYTPPTGATGNFTFEYYVCDDALIPLCDTAEVVISVEDYDVTYNVNNNPVANDDNLIATNSITIVDVLANDFDIDGDSITITNVFNVDPNLTVLLNSDSSLVAVIVNPGTPSGEYTFEYVICDDGNPVLCDTAELTIYVEPVDPINPAPFAVDDANGTIVNVSVSGNVMDNDILPMDGDVHSVSLVDNPTNGTVVLNPDGTYTYTPDTDYFGA
ncbi:MAG: tandem-95 repeat protein, partial [Methanosarcinales archaeon]|nr:tandem-95 repeat protein [Methanosarcinales archaeon]